VKAKLASVPEQKSLDLARQSCSIAPQKTHVMASRVLIQNQGRVGPDTRVADGRNDDAVVRIEELER
jgi:hypothetical protein